MSQLARPQCEENRPAAPAGPGAAPEQAAGGGAGAAATATRPAPSRPRVDHLPPWRVILHNCDEIDMEHVVRTLVELTPLNATRAFTVMMEAHTTGLALVLVTHRERAELYRDQFRSKSLTVTIEPAE